MGIFKRRNNDALATIYREKGFYCEEYIEAFRAAHPRLRSDDHFTLCELYIEMEQYDAASKELLSVRSGSLLDIITPAQHAFCRIAIGLGSGDYKDALSIYEENVKFLDTFMRNPARAKIAGDYYSYAAILCALRASANGAGSPSGTTDLNPDGKARARNSSSAPDVEKYLARLREWCDIYPRHRLLLEITEVAVRFAREKEEAEESAERCRRTILDFPDFNYEWEREYFLRKLDRAARLRNA